MSVPRVLVHWPCPGLVIGLLGVLSLLSIEARFTSAQDSKENPIFRGHADAVTAVAITSDGKMLVSGSEDGTVRLWDLATAKEKRTFTTHRGVTCVAFSSDGKWMAAGFREGELPGVEPRAADRSIRVWDVATGQEKTGLVAKRFPRSVWSVQFSPDSKTLASGEGDFTTGGFKLWDVESGNEKVSVGEEQYGWISSLAFTADGKTLASSSVVGTIMLWDVTTSKAKATLQGEAGCALSVAFTQDGATLVSGYGESSRQKSLPHVILWDVASGKERARLKQHRVRVASVAITPNGKILATGGGDKTIRLWDMATLKELGTLKGHTGGVNALVFTPDGNTLVSGSADKTIRLWDVKMATNPQK